MNLNDIKSKLDRVKAEISFEYRERQKLFTELEAYGFKTIEQAEKHLIDLYKDIEELTIKEIEALNAARQIMDNISNE